MYFAHRQSSCKSVTSSSCSLVPPLLLPLLSRLLLPIFLVIFLVFSLSFLLISYERLFFASSPSLSPFLFLCSSFLSPLLPIRQSHILPCFSSWSVLPPLSPLSLSQYLHLIFHLRHFSVDHFKSTAGWRKDVYYTMGER